MINKPKYSLIVHYNELLEEDIDYIIEILTSGVVVHLFLEGSLKEELEFNEYNDEFFDVAKENSLLFVYEKQEDLWDENIIIAEDNKILHKELYKKISSNKSSEFNHQQYDIVTAREEGNYIVVSGAGTGKTTTMINRLIYLRKTQRDFTFDKAALITFTNKASREMRERLIGVLDRYYKVTKDPSYLDMMDEAARCTISTIHGFSKKLINQYGKSIGLNKDVKIRSFKYKRKKGITFGLDYLYKHNKEIYEEIKYYPLYDVEDKLLAIWEKLDNYSIDINSKNYKVDFGVEDKRFSELAYIVISKAQEYIEYDREHEVEIADLMKKLVYKELFVEAKGKYSYIMVDEFQDSDNIQIDFVSNFCNIAGAKLLVVGDEKQSIYRFRGAQYTSFCRLKETLKKYNMPIEVFTMIRNYRTYSKLLDEINDVFIKVDNKVEHFTYDEKDYIYSLVNRGSNSSIDYISLPEIGEQTGDFYSDILEKKKNGEYIAVLFRSNSDLKEFKKFCERRSIPCRVDVTGSFYRHEVVRDFYVMIKGLLDSKSNKTRYSLIETPYINVVINKEKVLRDDRVIMAEYFDGILSSKEWEKYQKLVSQINILELIDMIINELKPVKEYYKRELLKAKENNRNYKNVAYVKTLEYKLNLEHLLYIIKDNFSESVSSIYSVEEFLKLKISTDNTVDVRRPADVYDNNFLQCSTIHKAKGLEYDCVIIPKLTNPFITGKDVDVILRDEEGKVNVGFKVKFDKEEYKNNFYSNYLKDEKSEIVGEEARLLYVAMTRCKKKLYINSSGLGATEGQNNWKSLIGGAKSYV